MLARGLVFGVVGAYLILAAVRTDPDEAVAIHGALVTLARQSYGPWLPGMVGVGFVSYGLYELMLAWRRRFHVE
jgi:hypothetical protein